MHEVPMELLHNLGVVEDDLGYEGARLQIAAPLALEQVPLGADDSAVPQPI